MKKGPDANHILSIADDMIRERGMQYGHPAINHMRIAQFWTTYLEYPIQPDQVAMMMALVKIARLVESPQLADSYIDLTAYAAISAQLAMMDWEDFSAYPEK